MQAQPEFEMGRKDSNDRRFRYLRCQKPQVGMLGYHSYVHLYRRVVRFVRGSRGQEVATGRGLTFKQINIRYILNVIRAISFLFIFFHCFQLLSSFIRTKKCSSINTLIFDNKIRKPYSIHNVLTMIPVE